MHKEREMEKKPRTISKLTAVRLLASGALLGVTLASIFGVDLNSSFMPGAISSTAGAASAAIILKLAHVL